jgi:hypothetical protein
MSHRIDVFIYHVHQATVSLKLSAAGFDSKYLRAFPSHCSMTGTCQVAERLPALQPTHQLRRMCCNKTGQQSDVIAQRHDCRNVCIRSKLGQSQNVGAVQFCN